MRSKRSAFSHFVTRFYAAAHVHLSGSAQEFDSLPERPAFQIGGLWLIWKSEGTGLDKGSRMAGIPGLSDGD